MPHEAIGRALEALLRELLAARPNVAVARSSVAGVSGYHATFEAIDTAVTRVVRSHWLIHEHVLALVASLQRLDGDPTNHWRAAVARLHGWRLQHRPHAEAVARFVRLLRLPITDAGTVARELVALQAIPSTRLTYLVALWRDVTTDAMLQPVRRYLEREWRSAANSAPGSSVDDLEFELSAATSRTRRAEKMALVLEGSLPAVGITRPRPSNSASPITQVFAALEHQFDTTSSAEKLAGVSQELARIAHTASLPSMYDYASNSVRDVW